MILTVILGTLLVCCMMFLSVGAIVLNIFDEDIGDGDSKDK